MTFLSASIAQRISIWQNLLSVTPVVRNLGKDVIGQLVVTLMEKVKVSSWCFMNSTVWFCCSLLVSRWNIPKPTGNLMIWGQEVTFSGPGLARTHQWKNFNPPCKKQAVPFSRWQWFKRSLGISEGETAKNSWNWKRHGTCHSLLGPAYSQDPIVEWASCSVSSDRFVRC